MECPDRSRRTVLVSFLVLFAVALAAHVPVAMADPSIADQGNGRKTLTWDFVDQAAYKSTGVEIGPAGVSLLRDNRTWIQTTDNDFATNGTPDPQVTIGGGSLRLRGNEGSLTTNGNFSSGAGWAFTSSPSGLVLAAPGDGTGDFTHSTPDKGSQFDSLDTGTGWTAASSGFGAVSIPNSEAAIRREGTGSVNDTVTLDNSGKWAGIQKETLLPWNFTPYNQISVWLNTTYPGPGQLQAVLNLRSSAAEWNSLPVRISTTWRLARFNISSFGNNLDSIIRVQFRFTGVVVTPTIVYIDDVWQRYFKSASEAASIVQVFSKSTTNPGAPGSALLRWDTSALAITNVSEARLEFSVSHSSGVTVSWSTIISSVSGWSTRLVDVSAAMANPGSYSLTFSLRVRLDTDSKTNAVVRIDNVVLLSPDYSNGVYVSNALGAGSPAHWTRISWVETADPDTDILVDVRSGGMPAVGDPTWSPWTTHEDPTGEAILAKDNTYLQFRVRLVTRNISRTPSLLELKVEFSQFAPSGTVETRSFTPNERLLAWRRFNALADVPLTTTVEYAISDGTSWKVILPGADLTGITAAGIQVRAFLSTRDSSQSPRIIWMSVTYEYEGPLYSIEISPASWQGTADDTVQLTALGYDRWTHAVALAPIWETTDPNGTVVDGLYSPGSAGTWVVRGLASDRSVVREVTVVVSAGVLARLALTPSATTESAGSAVTLLLAGFDGDDNRVLLATTEWSTTAGTFVEESPSRAVLRLPDGPGDVTVTARHGTLATSTTVVVTSKDLPVWAQLASPWSAIGLAALAVLLVWGVYFRYPQTLEDVFVIARDGRLVVHKTRRLRPDRDEDLFAAMLTAIAAFVRDSFKEEKTELDRFGLGDHTVYVERGDFGYVAAIYGGSAPPWAQKNLAAFVSDLGHAYSELIRSWSGDRDEVREVGAMTEAFVRRRRYTFPWRRARVSGAA